VTGTGGFGANPERVKRATSQVEAEPDGLACQCGQIVHFLPVYTFKCLVRTDGNALFPTEGDDDLPIPIKRLDAQFAAPAASFQSSSPVRSGMAAPPIRARSDATSDGSPAPCEGGASPKRDLRDEAPAAIC